MSARSILAGSLILALGCLWGCAREGGGDEPELCLSLALEPSPPLVGTANVLLDLATADGRPVEGAAVRLEGNMNHAGMKPSFSELSPREAGQYAGRLEFTMAGDWFILVNVDLPDGRQIERRIDVRGVTAP